MAVSLVLVLQYEWRGTILFAVDVCAAVCVCGWVTLGVGVNNALARYSFEDISHNAAAPLDPT